MLGSTFGSIFLLFHIRVARDHAHSSCQPQLLVTVWNLSLILMLSKAPFTRQETFGTAWMKVVRVPKK